MGIEQEISQNRRQTTRLESYQREVAPQQTIGLGAPAGQISVGVAATLYERPLGQSLISGHPDPEHGSGRGISGDDRGAWAEIASTADGSFVDDGRAALAAALAGAQRGIDTAAVGSDGTTASGADTGLRAPGPPIHAWHGTPDSQTLTATAEWRFSDVRETIRELGLYDDEADLLARLTTADVTLEDRSELRAEFELSYSHSASGQAAVTTMATIAHALATPAEAVGINEIALGTDDTAPSTNDTALGNQVITKTAAADVQRSSVVPWTLVTRSEPDTQPHEIVELGAIDQAGDLVWRVVFGSETKDDRVRLRPRSPLQF